MMFAMKQITQANKPCCLFKCFRVGCDFGDNQYLGLFSTTTIMYLLLLKLAVRQILPLSNVEWHCVKAIVKLQKNLIAQLEERTAEGHAVNSEFQGGDPNPCGPKRATDSYNFHY